MDQVDHIVIHEQSMNHIKKAGLAYRYYAKSPLHQFNTRSCIANVGFISYFSTSGLGQGINHRDVTCKGKNGNKFRKW